MLPGNVVSKSNPRLAFPKKAQVKCCGCSAWLCSKSTGASRLGESSGQPKLYLFCIRSLSQSVAFPGLPYSHHLLPSLWWLLPPPYSSLARWSHVAPTLHLALLQTWDHPGGSSSTVAASAPTPLHPCPSESTTAIPTLTALHLSRLCAMPTIPGSVSGSGEAEHSEGIQQLRMRTKNEGSNTGEQNEMKQLSLL